MEGDVRRRSHPKRKASEPAMDMATFFGKVEATLVAKFNETAVVTHPGDKGDNREEILRELLRQQLPMRYGVVKGQIITREGMISHSADIIVYDAVNCPVLYRGQTAVVPIEGVHGIIEVKSALSKPELVDAMTKIAAFKKLAPRDLGVIKTREYVTVHRPSRPFGAVFAFSIAGNSLESLADNYAKQHAVIHDINCFTNMVCVLGAGLLHFEKIDLERGDRSLLLDTDEFVDLRLLADKRERAGEPALEVLVRVVADPLADRSLGRFFVYLLIMLARQKLGVPDLGRYLDPDLPVQIVRES